MNKSEALNILGLGNKYTEEEVKKAYRTLAKKYHPDIAGEQNNHMFAEINKAYEFLVELGGPSSCILTHKTIFDVERV